MKILTNITRRTLRQTRDAWEKDFEFLDEKGKRVKRSKIRSKEVCILIRHDDEHSQRGWARLFVEVKSSVKS